MYKLKKFQPLYQKNEIFCILSNTIGYLFYKIPYLNSFNINQEKLGNSWTSSREYSSTFFFFPLCYHFGVHFGENSNWIRLASFGEFSILLNSKSDIGSTIVILKWIHKQSLCEINALIRFKKKILRLMNLVEVTSSYINLTKNIWLSIWLKLKKSKKLKFYFFLIVKYMSKIFQIMKRDWTF